MMMDLQGAVARIAADIGRDAATIEASAEAKEPDAPPGGFAIAIAPLDGPVVAAGDATMRFPIQSISKVLALDLALRDCGDAVFERVGREPSGDPFDSMVDLERTRGVPRNPFINAGALVIVDMLLANSGSTAQDAMADFVRDQTSDCPVTLDETVLREGRDLNHAMLRFMRHHGNVRSPIDAILDAYIRQCAVTVDCTGLAEAGRFLAHTRLVAGDAAHNTAARRRRAVLALMMTCGHYDGSGDFAIRVGLPAKSGVGGGILAIAPEIASIAVWSPNLDQQGNSILGVRALEMLATATGWSVFGPPLPAGADE